MHVHIARHLSCSTLAVAVMVGPPTNKEHSENKHFGDSCWQMTSVGDELTQMSLTRELTHLL